LDQNKHKISEIVGVKTDNLLELGKFGSHNIWMVALFVLLVKSLISISQNGVTQTT